MQISGAVAPIQYTAPDGTAVEVTDSTPLPTNAATEATAQETSFLLRRMLSVLAKPVNYDAALNRERVTAILESGTVTTVTTVTTAGTVTNIGAGRAGIELQDNANRTAWALVHRARIT